MIASCDVARKVSLRSPDLAKVRSSEDVPNESWVWASTKVTKVVRVDCGLCRCDPEVETPVGAACAVFRRRGSTFSSDEGWDEGKRDVD